MIRQTLVETAAGPSVLATFTLPGFIWADAIYLVGDFNDWNESSHRFRQERSGNWELSVQLEPDRAYAVSYICDGTWFVDDHADGYVAAIGGRTLFLVKTEVERVRSRPSPHVAESVPVLPAS